MTFGAAFVNSVEGMQAQSDALGVISQNIANVNTTGYKTTTDNFATLLSGSDGMIGVPIGSGSTMNVPNSQFGVTPVQTQQVDTQGQILSTSLWNNLAINGEGMFVVSQFSGSGALDAQGQAQNSVTGNIASGTDLTTATPLAYTRAGDMTEQTGPLPTSVTSVSLSGTTPISYDSSSAQTSAGPSQLTVDFSDGTQSTISLDFSQLTQGASGLSQISNIVNNGVAASGSSTGTATSTLQFQGSLTGGSSAPVTVTVPVVDASGATANVSLTLTPSSGGGTTSWQLAAEPVHNANPTVYLTDSQGNYFMGWQAVNGVVTPSTDASSLTAVNFTTGSSLPGQETTQASLQATLPANSTGVSSLSVPVYDDQFNAQTMQIDFTPVSPNQWAASFSIPSTDASGTVAQPTTPESLAFDAAGNYSATASTSQPTINIGWADGTDSTISLDLSQMSEIAGTTNPSITNITQNGVPAGSGQNIAPTTQLSLQGSLPGAGGGPFTQSATIYDNEGQAQTVDLTFAQNGSNNWTVTASLPPPPAPVVTIGSTTSSSGAVTSGGLSGVTFSGGTVASGGTSSFNLTWPDGSTGTLNLDLSQLTEAATGTTSVNASADGGNSAASSTVMLTGDLPSSSLQPITVDAQVYDSAGQAQTVQLQLTQAGNNSWNVSTTVPPTLSFNGNGQLLGTTNMTVNVTWPDGTTVPVNLDMSKLTQLAGTQMQVGTITQNGYAPGTLLSTNFDANGNLYGVYSNGQQQVLYQMALASFPNENDLTEENGNVYLANDYQVNGVDNPDNGSGHGTLFALPDASQSPESQPVTGASGTTIVPGALEQSNVDLAQQFSTLIVAQQAYNSASESFKIADQMIETARDLIT